MFRELKTEEKRRRGVRGRQVDWKYALLAAGQDWAVWSPCDLTSGHVDRELDRLGGLPSA
jgi:hypothetical protein